jgi:hypothetical protein
MSHFLLGEHSSGEGRMVISLLSTIPPIKWPAAEKAPPGWQRLFSGSFLKSSPRVDPGHHYPGIAAGMEARPTILFMIGE